MLASTLGASALAQAPSPSQTAAEPPSAPGAPAVTAPAGPAKIAVIQFEAVVGQTNEGQRAFNELNTKFQPKQQQIKALNDEVDTLKKDLQTAGDKLSDAERQTRLRTIDEKEKTLQRNVEDARNDFSGEMNEKFSGIAQKVAGVMTQYAQQNGYTLFSTPARSSSSSRRSSGLPNPPTSPKPSSRPTTSSRVFRPSLPLLGPAHPPPPGPRPAPPPRPPGPLPRTDLAGGLRMTVRSPRQGGFRPARPSPSGVENSVDRELSS